MVDDANDSDEMLGARLDLALRAGLGHDRVDVATLLHGSRRRARQVRTRRTAAVVAATALAVAVPVGYEVVNPGPGATAPPAALFPSSSRPAATHGGLPTARPDPAAVPSAVPPTTDGGSTGFRGSSTAISDAFAFTAAELPTGLHISSATQNASTALVEGLPCASPQSLPRPAISRQWAWSADGLSVSLTVTGWPTGKAAGAFTDTIKAARSCSPGDLPDLPSPDVLVPGDDRQVWASTSEAEGKYYCRALVQIGNKIAGVQVQSSKSVVAAAELANKLVERQIIRLRSGL